MRDEDADAEDFAAGLEAYRAGRYFEAHEHWERAWRRQTHGSDARRLLSALVQIAAAAHKVTTGVRPRGAPAILARAADKLAVSRPAFGVDPASLSPRVVAFRERVVRALAEGGVPMDRTAVPDIVSG